MAVCNGRPLYEGVDWNSSYYPVLYLSFRSPSLRGRGLKYFLTIYGKTDGKGRPLYEGVDWNIVLQRQEKELSKSPSLRGRGLKLTWQERHWRYTGRPLYEGVDWNKWYRGIDLSTHCRPLYEGVDWNQNLCQFLTRKKVALFTRAWIEISNCKCKLGRRAVALFTRAWIEINPILIDADFTVGRPLYEGVDWNLARYLGKSGSFCRPLYEGVDWNIPYFGF